MIFSSALFHATHNEQSLYPTTGQNENDLEHGSVKHRLNSA